MKDLNYFKRVTGYIFSCTYAIAAFVFILFAIITKEWYYLGYTILSSVLAILTLSFIPKTREYLKYCSECEEITDHIQITRTLCECNQCGHPNDI